MYGIWKLFWLCKHGQKICVLYLSADAMHEKISKKCWFLKGRPTDGKIMRIVPKPTAWHPLSLDSRNTPNISVFSASSKLCKYKCFVSKGKTRVNIGVLLSVCIRYQKYVSIFVRKTVVFPGAISCRGVSLRPSEKPTMCGRMTLFACFFRAKCKWLKKWRLQYWFLVERKIVFPCGKDSRQLKDSNPQYRTLWDIKLHVVNPLQ